MFALQIQVANQINDKEVKCLWNLNWKKITNGYNAEALKTLVTNIKRTKDRIAAVKACRMHYRYHVMLNDFSYYQSSWGNSCQFKEFCDTLIWDLEESDSITIGDDDRPLPMTEHLKAGVILESEYAQKLLERLTPKFIIDGKWREEVTKSIKSQIAHVLSVLLGIPKNRKWIYFEHMWDEPGLAKAFFARYSRPLDDDILELFPEYPGRY